VSDTLLPNNATPQERALDGATSRITSVPVPIASVWDPDTCPVDLLPWLAWAFSVDEWSPDWDELQKRDAVRQSVDVHRHKGTLAAVRTAMAAVGIEVELREWFTQSPAGDPYTFQLVLNARQYPITQEAIQKLLLVVESAKNLRSHISDIAPGATGRSDVFAAATTCIGNEITVKYNGV